MAKTALGLEERVETALCYLGLWVTGLIFYFIDNKNKTIRFHAIQSILVFLPLSILGVIFGGFFGVYSYTAGWFFLVGLSWLYWFLFLVLWLFLVLKAFQGKKLKLPIVGNIAEKNS